VEAAVASVAWVLAEVAAGVVAAVALALAGAFAPVLVLAFVFEFVFVFVGLGPACVTGCGEELPVAGKLSPLPSECWPLLDVLLRTGLALTLSNVSEKPCWAAGAPVCPVSELN
jgi:hypothetical protein